MNFQGFQVPLLLAISRPPTDDQPSFRTATHQQTSQSTAFSALLGLNVVQFSRCISLFQIPAAFCAATPTAFYAIGFAFKLRLLAVQALAPALFCAFAFAHTRARFSLLALSLYLAAL